MIINTTTYFDKKLSKKIKKNPQLTQRLKKQIKFFKKNPQHPSLKLHKLSGNRINEYSFWIEKNLRITFIKIKNLVLFTDLITHDQY